MLARISNFDEPEVVENVKRLMENYNFRVPIVAEIKWSDTHWGDKKALTPATTAINAIETSNPLKLKLLVIFHFYFSVFVKFYFELLASKVSTSNYAKLKSVIFLPFYNILTLFKK